MQKALVAPYVLYSVLEESIRNVSPRLGRKTSSPALTDIELGRVNKEPTSSVNTRPHPQSPHPDHNGAVVTLGITQPTPDEVHKLIGQSEDPAPRSAPARMLSKGRSNTLAPFPQSPVPVTPGRGYDSTPFEMLGIARSPISEPLPSSDGTLPLDTAFDRGRIAPSANEKAYSESPQAVCSPNTPLASSVVSQSPRSRDIAESVIATFARD